MLTLAEPGGEPRASHTQASAPSLSIYTPATGPALTRGKEQSSCVGSRLQVIVHGDPSGTQDGEQTSKIWDCM